MTTPWQCLAFALLALGCASTAPAPPAAPAPTAPPSAAPAPEAAKAPVPLSDATRLMELPIVERADLVEPFEREAVSGTIALFDSSTGVLSCSDVARCRRAHLPASTYKIPNSIIALETGVVSDSETVLAWDGITRSNPDWNQDLTLRTAIRVSCVPCYQGIARQVGEARMQDWLTRLDYGNRNMGGGLDQFWLRGALRITPIEQLDFLRRLELGKLPISERTREIVLDIIALDVAEDYVLRGKTGWAGPPEVAELALWFVGWVERGPRRIYFATELDGYRDGVEFLKSRRRVTEVVLAKLGVLPER